MQDLKTSNRSGSLPHSAWPADRLRSLERNAADALGLTLFELMQRAGEALWRAASARFPAARHWLILCGHGNNGGDGYVLARLARSGGCNVTLLAVESERPLPEEAALARDAWLNAGGEIHSLSAPWPEQVDVIVDALLGTGLNRAPDGPVAAVIAQINQHPAPAVAADVPSGLMASSGAVPGVCVTAALTVSFIVLKSGLLTGKARDYVGELQCDALGLSVWLKAQPAPWQRLDAALLPGWLPPRRPTSHKGDHGKLLLIGGDRGTAGAIRMAAEAALRTGAGLVRVLTHKTNLVPLLTARPELMVDELDAERLDAALAWADIITVGPGLGQREWGKNALSQVKTAQKPMLWDADALNLLAFSAEKRQNRVITPHPGEAARLLGCTVTEIEHDRLRAAQRLAERYGGTVVLKGAGTLIVSQQGEQAIADVGNPGMAAGGMGDVLSGIISSLMAQGLAPFTAACAGCVVHGAAADLRAQRYGTRGMLATDLFTALYPFVNPGIAQEE
ncbi:bifunctional ADP-dependent NAD(P)H-hydrate dehydratase/NAD(P)H-hydrate epimerase [Pantoea sp. 1.19]|uniref:bifunctional ADP-dependent NAD(P)H-hydrate dehydratase/NAD(P)H-hydrate epimerase n=1 Tax=Pantoea sp. 1.19 TaxID=1925589 RepID=UPI00094899CB|nr:bifunctional ADP-dependent NAD(P)H-hydrate dehydratase/NAD(P)H-hydrate epimerase [Pantoea sp. 1.19]